MISTFYVLEILILANMSNILEGASVRFLRL